MDILPGLVFILVGFATLGWIVSPGTARGLDQFAAGFLPYRSAGWPQGVQEEDPVPWSWSVAREPEMPVAGSDSDSDGGAEIVEIGSAGAPAATAVDPGPTVDGMARRRR